MRVRRYPQGEDAHDELFPELVAVLLEGWAAPIDRTDPDPFRLYDHPWAERHAVFAAVWRRHRARLLAIARRRGIKRPLWAERQFDRDAQPPTGPLATCDGGGSEVQ